MCGISGLYSLNGTPDIDRVERMNQESRHRGPDDSGLYTDGSVGLAHRRLSIIDLSGGRQPIFNEDESIVIIFNGEIYNYQMLRDSLSSAGHTFTTETDTEVLVHLYEEHGASFVKHLEGMFAFALWDRDENQLMLARDPMGIKPLFLIENDETIGFASELPSLLSAELDPGGLNRRALGVYFAFGYIPAPSTAFQNIRKIEPGEYVIISKDTITQEQFYQPKAKIHDPGFKTAAQELRSRIERAVKKRLMSDVPLGAFLSGGIDSSIIVGTMVELAEEPIDTFTVGFDNHLYDESWAARELAEYHGTNHHEFTMSADDVREIVPEVLSRLGEPFADQSLLPSYLVARETSQEVKVALSGDGADELFAGYDKYRVESLSKYYRTLPKSMREGVIQPLVNSTPTSRGHRVSNLLYKTQWFVNRSGSSAISDRHFELMRIYDETAAESFDEVNPATIGRKEMAIQHQKLLAELQEQDALTRIQAVDLQYSLPNQMLCKVDRASMYNSLEVRVPFLDKTVVEYALSLPKEYKINARSRKRVLKHAFDDVLPRSIRKRDKQGFDMPISEWFRNELYDDFREIVTSINLGVLDDEAVLRIHDEHRRGRRDHGKFLWSVFVFKHWGYRMKKSGLV